MCVNGDAVAVSKPRSVPCGPCLFIYKTEVTGEVVFQLLQEVLCVTQSSATALGAEGGLRRVFVFGALDTCSPPAPSSWPSVVPVDYVKGFGGKFGVQTDRQDKCALGWDHQEKPELHDSQKGTALSCSGSGSGPGLGWSPPQAPAVPALLCRGT